MEAISPVINDIIAWGSIQYLHAGQDIYEHITSRSNTAIKIIARDPAIQLSKDSADTSKAFRSYFIKEYDNYKIARINSHYKDLGKQKKEGYVVRIAALTAVLFDHKVLSRTYKATLTFIFDKLGITEDPAQFKRSSMKGTVPANWAEVMEIFGVSSATLWRWSKDYLIPEKIGNNVRYKLSEIEKIMGESRNV
jgi:predicted DNA-binding transcriptional regulator AlpA